jgi:hypothetical protein
MSFDIAAPAHIERCLQRSYGTGRIRTGSHHDVSTPAGKNTSRFKPQRTWRGAGDYDVFPREVSPSRKRCPDQQSAQALRETAIALS